MGASTPNGEKSSERRRVQGPLPQAVPPLDSASPVGGLLLAQCLACPTTPTYPEPYTAQGQGVCPALFVYVGDRGEVVR